MKHYECITVTFDKCIASLLVMSTALYDSMTRSMKTCKLNIQQHLMSTNWTYYLYTNCKLYPKPTFYLFFIFFKQTMYSRVQKTPFTSAKRFTLCRQTDSGPHQNLQCESTLNVPLLFVFQMDPVQKAVINHTFGVSIPPKKKLVISCNICQLRFNSDVSTKNQLSLVICVCLFEGV